MANSASIANDLINLKSSYSNDDIDWVKFVQDHYQRLFDTCTEEELKPESHYWRYYRLEDYLREQGIDPNVSWIVLMINQMSSKLDFKEMESIRLPDMKVIRGLRQSYMQYRCHIKGIR